MFQTQVRDCTATIEDEEALVRALTARVEEMHAAMQSVQVAAKVVEFFFVHAACDDLVEKLAAPMLMLIRDRLAGAARQHAKDRAEKALQEILAAEEVSHGACGQCLTVRTSGR